jgi:hypothetical protein
MIKMTCVKIENKYDHTDCVICIENLNMESPDLVCELNCGHVYHTMCFVEIVFHHYDKYKYIIPRYIQCPMCYTSVSFRVIKKVLVDVENILFMKRLTVESLLSQRKTDLVVTNLKIFSKILIRQTKDITNMKHAKMTLRFKIYELKELRKQIDRQQGYIYSIASNVASMVDIFFSSMLRL